MPFGQSLLISRFVGGIVKLATGDDDLATAARYATKVVVAVATLDVGGALIDGAIDSAADTAIDHLADSSLDEVTHHAGELMFGTASGVHYHLNSELVAGHGWDSDDNPVTDLGYSQ
jgi:hypothetical protein